MEKTLISFNLLKSETGNGFLTSSYFCRELAATNVSCAPTYVHFQGWSLKLTDCRAEYKEKVPDVSDFK